MAATTSSKTVLITGSTRGIGLKLTELFIQRGWNVIAAARNPTTADQLKALSPYKIVQLDSSDEASVKRAAKELEGEAIDLLINNAGIFLGGTPPNIFSGGGLVDTTTESLLQQFQVNAVGPFIVTRAFVPHLKAAVAAHDVAFVAQISSFLGSIELNTGGGLYGYRASKAAVNQINKSLAVDLVSDKIGAFVLHPGYVSTDLTGFQADITTETSAQGLIQVIDKFSLADSGSFYDYTGKGMPW